MPSIAANSVIWPSPVIRPIADDFIDGSLAVRVSDLH
jgi:hypothetical protein